MLITPIFFPVADEVTSLYLVPPSSPPASSQTLRRDELRESPSSGSFGANAGASERRWVTRLHLNPKSEPSPVGDEVTSLHPNPMSEPSPVGDEVTSRSHQFAAVHDPSTQYTIHHLGCVECRAQLDRHARTPARTPGMNPGHEPRHSDVGVHVGADVGVHVVADVGAAVGARPLCSASRRAPRQPEAPTIQLNPADRFSPSPSTGLWTVDCELWTPNLTVPVAALSKKCSHVRAVMGGYGHLWTLILGSPNLTWAGDFKRPGTESRTPACA